MKTKRYIETFNLNHPSEKDLERFSEAFGQELKERLDLTLEARHRMGIETPFTIFASLVKEQEGKFNSISYHSSKKLSRKIWNKFYASFVIPLRKEYFPEEHQKISQSRSQDPNSKFDNQL